MQREFYALNFELAEYDEEKAELRPFDRIIGGMCWD
jgi:hypothetical protein